MHTTSPCHLSSISTFNKQTPSCPRLLRLLPLHLKLSQQYHCMWHLQKLLNFPRCQRRWRKTHPKRLVFHAVSHKVVCQNHRFSFGFVLKINAFPKGITPKMQILLWRWASSGGSNILRDKTPHSQCRLEAGATFKLSKGSATWTVHRNLGGRR